MLEIGSHCDCLVWKWHRIFSLGKTIKKKKRNNSPTLCLLFAGGNSRGQSVFTANNLPSGAALGVFGTDTTHRMIINLRLDVRIALRPTDLEA